MQLNFLISTKLKLQFTLVQRGFLGFQFFLYCEPKNCVCSKATRLFSRVFLALTSKSALKFGGKEIRAPSVLSVLFSSLNSSVAIAEP